MTDLTDVLFNHIRLDWQYRANKRERLTARNAEIYYRRAAGETLATIAKAYGISTERVRQIYGRQSRTRQRAAEIADGVPW